eukprot:26246-Lingulodinium_polyedra.AAC.1
MPWRPAAGLAVVPPLPTNAPSPQWPRAGPPNARHAANAGGWAAPANGPRQILAAPRTLAN